VDPSFQHFLQNSCIHSSHACYTSSPYHLPCCQDCNNMWRGEHIMNLFIMEYSQPSCFFPFLSGQIYFPSLCYQRPSICVFFQGQRQRFTPISNGIITYIHGTEFSLTKCHSFTEKLCRFYGTRTFIIVFTTAFHWSLLWATWNQFIISYPVTLRSILQLSYCLFLGLPSGLFFPSGFPTRTLYASHHSTPATCPAHPIHLHLISIIICCSHQAADKITVFYVLSSMFLYRTGR